MVLPIALLATTAAIEFVGLSAFLALGPILLIWGRSTFRSFRHNRTRMRYDLGFLAVTVLAILVLRSPSPAGVPDDLAEAMFRELLSEPRGRIYYLEVDGKDPRPELIQRLSDLGLRIKARSQALIGSADDPEEWHVRQVRNVKDRDSGEYGTLLSVFDLGRPEHFSVFTMEVDVETYTGMFNAEGQRSIVMRVLGWKTVGTTSAWIT